MVARDELSERCFVAQRGRSHELAGPDLPSAHYAGAEILARSRIDS